MCVAIPSPRPHPPTGEFEKFCICYFFDLGCRRSTDKLFLQHPAQVEVILDEKQLTEEIGFLRRTLKTKRSLASLRAGQGLDCSPAEARRPYEHSSTKISLLMDWVRTVCDFYSLKVSFELTDWVTKRWKVWLVLR